jgi:hypothetical protein
MAHDLAAPNMARPSREQLLADFGEEYLSIQSLFNFCFVPGGRLHLLKDLAVPEDWGDNNFVLLKYLAVHLRLAIEQGSYVWNADQIVVTAGRLMTPAGTPIYVGIVPNQNQNENPWVLNWVGERPSASELPSPPVLGPWPSLETPREIVIGFDLNSDLSRERLANLADATVTQASALIGAIHWSLARSMAIQQIHGGGRGFFVPLWLKSREDLSAKPDLVAPLFVLRERFIVRTLLDAEVAYPPARAVVERWEQLPTWLLDAWDQAIEVEPERDQDDVEEA